MLETLVIYGEQILIFSLCLQYQIMIIFLPTWIGTREAGQPL